MEQLYELNLRDFWSIFLKRKWEIIIAFTTVFSAIFIYTSLQIPIYRTSVLIKVEPLRLMPSELVFPAAVRYWGEQDVPVADYAKQLISRPILEIAAKELDWIKEDSSKEEKERMISDISDRVSATEIEKSSMIRLYAQFEDPQKATDIANKIAEVFKKVNAEQKNERTRNVRIFIEQTLKDVYAKLKVQEERLNALTTQGAVGSAVGIVARISDLENKLADLTGKYTENYPQVISVKDEITALKLELKNLPKEEFEYGILKRDIAINETLYSSLKKQLQESQIKEAEKIDNIILVNPAITPRAPFYPNKPRNYLVGIILGLILGFTTALLTEHLDTSIGRVDDVENFIKVPVVGIIPYCSEQYKDEREVSKKKHKLFSKHKSRTQWKPVPILELAKTDHASLFLEAFRLLSVNLQVLFGEGGKIKNKILMITSCKPEEGKTVVTSTLGVIMAQMGYKVLVIDCDVRRAHIHKTFGLKGKENGIMEILVGKINPEAAVKTATDIMLGTTKVENVVDKPWLNNLNIVTSGASFPNIVSLFNSNKLTETLNFFKEKYDIVLIDTSPILAVSEPSLLLPKVDGVLLVYRAGFTSRLALRRGKMQIESIKGKDSLGGIVLNNVTPEIGIDSYYYYNKKYYTDEDKSGSARREESRKNV
ncbi:MAG: polysaccharide biosynthesis tyrosine autokinase [Candidatus Omnitrophica bacterium]|nr:polysaccharide biosynthesis tyrosine autokinase [Candidatus Omnitrophota bacterium]